MISAATMWKSNAEMIADVAALGYLQAHHDVIDLTYGRGGWWRKFTPGSLTVGPYDFTDLPEHLNDRFDVVAFDPPYVSTGGRTTSTIPDFNDRYGLTDAPRTPRLMHDKNMLGLANAQRVAKPGGLILFKCADYISSGTLQLTSHWALCAALELGLVVQDRFIHVGHARPQPPNRGPQQHARNNYSTLWVLQRKKEHGKHQ